MPFPRVRLFFACLPASSKLCAILQGSQHGQMATVWSADDIKDKGVIVLVVRWLSMVIQLRFLQTWGTQSKTHQRRQGLIIIFWFVWCRPPTQGDCRSTARLAISTRQCTVGWSSVMAVFTPFQRSANECITLCKGKTMKNKAWTLSMSWNAELQVLPGRRPTVIVIWGGRRHLAQPWKEVVRKASMPFRGMNFAHEFQSKCEGMKFVCQNLKAHRPWRQELQPKSKVTKHSKKTQLHPPDQSFHETRC